MAPRLQDPFTGEPIRDTAHLDSTAKALAQRAAPELFGPRKETAPEKAVRVAAEVGGVDISGDVARASQPESPGLAVPYDTVRSEVQEDIGYKPADVGTTIKIIKHNAGLPKHKPVELPQPPAKINGSSETIGAVQKRREAEQQQSEDANPPKLS